MKIIITTALICVLGIGVVQAAPNALSNKDQCKNNGWKTSSSPIFKNQGDCVSFFTARSNNVNHSIKVEPLSATASSFHWEGNDYNLAAFTIKFKVTAVGKDIYLDDRYLFSQSTASEPLGGARVSIEDENGNMLGGGSEFGLQLTGDINAVQVPGHALRIIKGKTGIVTLEVLGMVGGTEGRAVLNGLEWRTAEEPNITHIYKLNMGADGSYVTPYQYFDSDTTYDNNHPDILVEPLLMDAEIVDAENPGEKNVNFSINFKVSAVGDDVYIAKAITNIEPFIGVNYIFVGNESGLRLPSVLPTISSTNSEELTYTYHIKKGESADFTASVVWPNASGYGRAMFLGLGWGVIDNAPSTNLYSENMSHHGIYNTDLIFID